MVVSDGSVGRAAIVHRFDECSAVCIIGRLVLSLQWRWHMVTIVLCRVMLDLFREVFTNSRCGLLFLRLRLGGVQLWIVSRLILRCWQNLTWCRLL